MSDFIPKISKYRNCLAQLLKKSPPEWNSVHTKAVQQLKKLAEKLPPLQIPGPGKRILQTDASNEYWAAALFEEIDGKRISFLSSVIILSEGLACLAGADSPGSLLGVAISESMEPGIKRGDLMFLNINKDPIHAGEIILFNVDGLDVPISHRVITVHGHRNTGKVYILTKGDNNHLDDRILYARGQRWLLRHHVIARVVGLLPYVGWIKLILTENPIIKTDS
ncbi:hypothetical protein SO802_000874 [Lithocarpus litseifolius]|uniref:Signal peptidase complex catalytic subunit SEC11 n=1 Tax=Lithocarpus litseifolius TaxID=425828 RepID=A0AAW2DWS0_9ROSI